MKRRRRGQLPPGPRGPGGVNTARLVQRPLETLLGWHARYGDVFTVRSPVFGTGVYVADPEAIRELLHRRPVRPARRRGERAARAVLGDALGAGARRRRAPAPAQAAAAAVPGLGGQRLPRR